MNLKKIKVIFCLLLVGTICSFSVKDYKLCKADVTCSDILFEPQNSIELQGFKDLDLPYIAGLASSVYSTAIFRRIDIYRLETDGTKTSVATKAVNAPIATTYDDYYLNYSGEQKQVKGAEPSREYDDITQLWSLNYENSLKEAIGYANGSYPSSEISEFNSPVLNKCYQSTPSDNSFDGSYIQIDLATIITTMTYGNEYVLLMDGVFSYEEQTTEQHFERTVTIFYKPPLAWRSEEAFSILSTTETETGSWYKGDGHVHSLYSDGKKWIYNYCCTPDATTPYKCKPSTDYTTLFYPRKHGEYGYKFENNHFVTESRPVLEKLTNAHTAYYRGKMDWMIMTDHAQYLFEPKQPGSPNTAYPCTNFDQNYHVGDQGWFDNYRWECRTAEKYIPIAVIPMEEVAVRKDCKLTNEDCTTMIDDNGGHMLNYNLLNGAENLYPNDNPDPYTYMRNSGRIASDTWGGKQLIREELNKVCECTDPTSKRYCNPPQPPGTYGWSVIAHPRFAGADPSDGHVMNWNCFSEVFRGDWVAKEFGPYNSDTKHKCPSVIRSYNDDCPNNNGKGVFAIELTAESGIATRLTTVNWDQYLFADSVYAHAYDHFESDVNSPAMTYVPHVYPEYDPDAGSSNGSIGYGNHFVIGVINSDEHGWFFQATEDTTAKVCNKEYIPIDDFDDREIIPFDDGKYIKSKLYNVPYISHSTYVYADNPANSAEPGKNHRLFLKQFRSCGKNNQGVTASLGGAWGTFAVRNKGTSTWVRSGGRIAISQGETQQVEVQISALGTYSGAIGNTASEIEEIRVYGCSGDINYFYNDKIPTPAGNTIMNYDSDYDAVLISKKVFTNLHITSLLPQIIPELEFNQLRLARYDYIRVEIQFRQNNKLEIGQRVVICNPVLVFNQNDTHDPNPQ